MAADRDIAQENREAYEYCRDNGHKEFIELAEKTDSYTLGDQWDEKALALLKRRRKPALTVNKILPVFATLAGEEIQRRGDISFRAAAGGDPAIATILDKLWLNFAQVQNLDWKESMAFWDGVIRSRGFLDLRVSFDDTFRGEPKLSYLNSKDVLLYPESFGYDPDDWTGVIVSKWLSSYDIHELYGVPLKDISYFADTFEASAEYADWRRDQFGTPLYSDSSATETLRAKHRLLRVIERQNWIYKRVKCFVEPNSGEIREVPQHWDRERIQLALAQFGYEVIDKRVKKIEWTTSVGELKLFQATSPLRHFTPIPYFPFLIGGRPSGVVQHLISPQDLLNKTLSQELHIVAGVANSGYKVKKGSLTNMSVAQLEERGGEDGIVLEYNTSPTDIEKLQPNQVPTGLDRLSYKAGEAMQQISLVSESMQGLDRADVSGVAIQAKGQKGSTALSPIYVSLDQTRRTLARNWLDIVQQFVTEERVYYVTGRSKTSQTEQVQVNVPQPDGSFLNDLTLGEYGLIITDIKARDSYDQEQVAYMVDMIRNGAPLPWSKVINALTVLEDREEIVAMLQQQEGQGGPSEEEQAQAELQRRMMEAQAMDKEASAQVKQAQAQKAMVEAQKTAGPEDTRVNDIKAQEALLKFQLLQEQVSSKIEQAREMSAIKAQEAEQQLAIAERSALSEQLRANEEATSKARLLQIQLDFERRKYEEMLEFERTKREEELAFLREKNKIELEKLKAAQKEQKTPTE